MDETVQNQLQFVDNKVLETRHAVTLFPISRNTPTQEQKRANNPLDRFHYFGRLSSTPLD